MRSLRRPVVLGALACAFAAAPASAAVQDRDLTGVVSAPPSLAVLQDGTVVFGHRQEGREVDCRPPGAMGLFPTSREVDGALTYLSPSGQTRTLVLGPSSDPTYLLALRDRTVFVSERAFDPVICGQDSEDREHLTRVTAGGAVTRMTLDGGGNEQPGRLAQTPDGAVWLTLDQAKRVLRLDRGGTLQSFPVPSSASQVAALRDSSVLLKPNAGGAPYVVSPSGQVTRYRVTSTTNVVAYASDPKRGVVWFGGNERSAGAGRRLTRVDARGRRRATCKLTGRVDLLQPRADGGAWGVVLSGGARQVVRVSAKGRVVQVALPGGRYGIRDTALGPQDSLHALGVRIDGGDTEHLLGVPAGEPGRVLCRRWQR